MASLWRSGPPVPLKGWGVGTIVFGTPPVGTVDVVVVVVDVFPFIPDRDFLILGLVFRLTPQDV